MNPARGEVWLYERPDRKPRPVLILTRDQAIGVLNRVLVVSATTAARAIPTHVWLDEADGMREPCALARRRLPGLGGRPLSPPKSLAPTAAAGENTKRV